MCVTDDMICSLNIMFVTDNILFTLPNTNRYPHKYLHLYSTVHSLHMIIGVRGAVTTNDDSTPITTVTVQLRNVQLVTPGCRHEEIVDGN